MAGDGEQPPARGEPTAVTPAQMKRRIATLVAERDRAEDRRRELTDQIRADLRRAHDVGVSWSELAEIAGYNNAETARVQALRRDEREHPEGSHSIREAADILGVSTQAIYDRIKAGRIQVAVDRPRGRRVYLPQDHSPSS